MELGFRLAQLLEDTEARNVAGWATEWIEVGGGIASFAGPTSPISHAIGLGMNGPVAESDLDRVEEFYRSRGAPSNLDLCPLADPSLMERLGRRGYRITEFNNVLVAPDPRGSAQPGVRAVNPDEKLLWTRVMIGGFFEKDQLTADELLLGEGIFAMQGARAFLAESEGVPAAAAAACVRGEVLYLFGDATLVPFRRRGLHSALIQARLAWGGEQGCKVASASTLPGSESQRHYVRAGFRIAYTKMNMCRDL